MEACDKGSDEYGVHTLQTERCDFDISEKSDDLYLIRTRTVQIESCEGLALATLEQGEMFGEMASILGER